MLSVFNRFRLIPRMSREVTEQYVSVMLRNFGVGMVRIFEPVFIYNLFNQDLKPVILYYAAQYLGRFFCLPLAGKIAARIGFEKTMALSLPLQVLYLFLLNLTQVYFPIIYFLPILGGFFLSNYWIAYHTNMAHYGNREERGRQFSFLNVTYDILGVIAPIIGGLILTFFGFSVLFFTASLIILLSCIPMLSTKEEFVPSRFSYSKAFSRLFCSYKTYKHNYFLTYFGYGVDSVSRIIWPIFIFLVLVQNFSLMGILDGIGILIISLYSLYIGQAYDRYHYDRNRMSFYTSLISYMIIWPIRGLVGNWWQILSVKILSGLFGRNLTVSIFSTMYRRSGIYGNLKYVVFFTQALNLGRVILMLFCFFGVWLFGFGFQAIFFSAGIWAVFMGLMWHKRSRGIA